MRHIARYTSGSCGNAALPALGGHLPDSSCRMPAGNPGPDLKVDLANLLPGGMTQDARSALSRLLHTRSPEPVLGFGGVQGIIAYYRVVLHAGTMMKYPTGE